MPTVPTLGPRYWVALCLASVFGADLGDWFAHGVGLGHWRGLPVLAVLFALTLRAARRTSPTEAWYWIGIIIVRTAATNFADWQTHDFRLPFAPLVACYAALLAGLVALSRRDRDAHGLPQANLFFWAGMLVAGTLGTVAGDDLSHALARGPAASSLVMSAVMFAAFAALSHGRAPAVRFWLLVVVVRTWGTDVGDWLAATLGLGADTLASGIAFAGLLLLWPDRPARARRAPPGLTV